MPRRIAVEMNPTRRRKWGYAFRIMREVVNGDDTGYTLVKAGVVIGSVVVGVAVAAFAPYIFAGGVVLTAMYVGIAWKDEYDRNKAEDAKLETLKNLDADIELASKKFAQKIDGDTLEDEYAEGNDDDYVDNQILLKYTLRDYLKRLNIKRQHDIDAHLLNKKRKRNGLLPNQNAMIELIEQVTGFDRFDTQFGAKVRKFFNQPCKNQITEFPDDFGNTVVKVLGFHDSGEDLDITVPIENKNHFFRDAIKTFKHGMSFVWKANTAMGLVVGGAVLLGFIVVGAPVTWPIIVLAAVVGILSGSAAVLYNRLTEKSYRKNNEAIDESLKEKKTKLALLDRLTKINSKQYLDRNEYSSQAITKKLSHDDERSFDLIPDDYSDDAPLIQKPRLNTDHHPVPNVPPLNNVTRARMITHVIAQANFGLSLGMLVGIAIASVMLIMTATVLPPVGIPLMVITAAGLSLGLIYGVRVAYMLGKASAKASKKEAKQLEEVDSSKRKSKTILGQENAHAFNKYVIKTKTELLIDVIARHVDYMAQLNARIAQAMTTDEQIRLISKKEVANEKILSLLENTTGLKRDRDVYRRINTKGDDEFYNKLAALIQGEDKEDTKHFERIVKELKVAVQGDSATAVTIAPAPSTWEKVKNAFSSGTVNNFLKNNITGGVMTVLSIALPLGFLLFSPAALPLVAGTVAVVATVYVVSRVCSWYAQKSLAIAKETEQKLPLVKRCIELDQNVAEGSELVNTSSLVEAIQSHQVNVATQKEFLRDKGDDEIPLRNNRKPQQNNVIPLFASSKSSSQSEVIGAKRSLDDVLNVGSNSLMNPDSPRDTVALNRKNQSDERTPLALHKKPKSRFNFLEKLTAMDRPSTKNVVSSDDTTPLIQQDFNV